MINELSCLIVQFQVFQSGMNALVLYIVLGDIGKPTTKLEKAAVRDGTCIWDNPVYETVKFVQESKTGKISDRIYHFVVSTGLPKASPIGEVSINFADYVETTKPSSVSLPIRISHCDVVLHVKDFASAQFLMMQFLLVRQ
ncbi:uncharacterized protein HKW66_Vig0079680 [Vigna angularis]|uniref:C2 NT-type domain-containing protein n=1 Tax=Phaseolus angularis TaxID=3914 RepID=A0A8T0K4M6_PHAAN|nr:uncharacterized protein HKW66_Vig0079680 [Vigna angularis]